MRLVTRALAFAMGVALSGCVGQPVYYGWPDEAATPDSYAGNSYPDYQEPSDAPEEITEPPPPLPVYE